MSRDATSIAERHRCGLSWTTSANAGKTGFHAPLIPPDSTGGQAFLPVLAQPIFLSRTDKNVCPPVPVESSESDHYRGMA
jgi:hypothetical protein